MERDLGEQPIKQIIAQSNFENSDLVAVSKENITYKMLTRACKGRLLTSSVQQKICNSLNNATGKNFSVKDLFNY